MKIEYKVAMIITFFILGYIIGNIFCKCISYTDQIKKLNNQIIEQTQQIEAYKEENIKLRNKLKE